MAIKILLLCLIAPLLHCFEYEYEEYEYEYQDYENEYQDYESEYQDYENEVYEYQEYQYQEYEMMDEDSACLDDNTAYYGNNLKILDGYDSSSECQMHCDKFSGCSFWSFRKSNGRCFLKNSKVPQATFMDFTFTITLHLYMFDVSIFLSIGWRKSVCS